MKIYEAIYYFLLKPENAIKKSISFEYSLIIYLIASLSIAISVIYVIGTGSNIFNLMVLSFGIASYIAISNIVKIAIINLSVSIFFNNTKNKIKIFINNCLGIYGIFIFILPITLLFSRFSNLCFIQIITLIILSIFYIFLLYKNIKYSFDIESSFKSILILITPIMCDYLTYISLAILIFGSIINII